MRIILVLVLGLSLFALYLAQTTDSSTSSDTSSSSTDGSSSGSTSSSSGGSSSESTSSSGGSTSSTGSSSGSSSGDSTAAPSSTTSADGSTTEGPKDANTTCQELHGGDAYGKADEDNSCQIACYIPRRNTRRAEKKRLRDQKDGTSCGDKKVCFNGQCESNDTPEAKACKKKYSNKSEVHGTHKGGLNSCQAVCHFSGSKARDTADLENGTSCSGARRSHTCQNGRCVKG